MSIRKLFLAHHSRYRNEVNYLAAELRLRGVVPWVDKDGGFEVADECEPEARRAIREECFGLMLYATQSAFGRWFIRHVELDEASKVYKKAREAGTEFDFFGVPRRIGYSHLGKESEKITGISLADMNTVSIPHGIGLDSWRYRTSEAAERARREFAARCEKLASNVAHRVIRRAAESGDKSTLSLQFRTRAEEMPDKPGDALFINAWPLFAGGLEDEHQWARLARGLMDVRGHIASFYARPRIHVHGSKHTTAAFLFGRVFARYPLDIQQTPPDRPGYIWASDAPDPGGSPFSVSVQADAAGDHAGGGVGPRALFIEVAVGHKNIAAAVDAFVEGGGLRPAVRLQLRSPMEGVPMNVDNSLCRALVRQTYAEIERVMKRYGCAEIHLFLAAHQAYTMMLGQEFRGMPSVHLYEWNGNSYVYSYSVPQDL